MRTFKVVNRRLFSVVGFSFLFAYILSFLFEGQVLYSLLEFYEVEASGYILAAIVGHFAGLFSCGYFVKSSIAAKYTILASIGVSNCSYTILFAPSMLDNRS